ncbi:hypothetical protein ACW95P_03770 [Candidatus Mycoplasma pogonae]
MFKNFLKNNQKWFFNHYTLLLLKIIIRKKNTLVVPLALFGLALILSITSLALNLNGSAFDVIFYSLIFVELLFTIIFISIKVINIFVEIEEEGIEVIVFSKKITRKNIILGKILTFITIAFAWAILILIFNLIFFAFNFNKINAIGNFLFFSLLSPFMAALFFGSVTSLIALKTNSKVALTLPTFIFVPLSIVGTFLNLSSVSGNNSYAHYLNIPTSQNAAGNIANLEKFYLKNHEDKFFILPNGFENKEFNEKQKPYLEKAFNYTKNSALPFQVFSWLSLPSQFIDIFSYENQNILNQQDNIESNLKNYFNFSKPGSIYNSYKLNKNPYLFKGLVKNISSELEEQYIVPGALKNQSQIPNLINSEIIYAREKADNFDVVFLEDSYTFQTPNNLVGKLKWKVLRDALESKNFNKIAFDFFKKINKNISKKDLIAKIAEFSNVVMDSFEDNNTILFNSIIDTHQITNLTEKQIYIITALAYYLYFSTENQELLQTLLKNDNSELEYTPSSLVVKLGEYNYNIGGFSSYSQIQKIINNKIVTRFQLQSNDNFLFQNIKDVYSVEAENTALDKNYYILIWVAFIGFLIFLNYRFYSKKDFR